MLNKIMKNKFTILITVIMTLSLILPINTYATSNEIHVIMNGQNVSFDVPPQIIKNRTMVPMRAIFEQFGMNVNWDGSTKTVTATKDDTNIILKVGDNRLGKNNISYPLDSPATIVKSRTLVPLRAISEALNANVNWDQSTRTVKILTKGYYVESTVV